MDWGARILRDEDGLVAVDKPAGWASTGRDLEDPECVQHALGEYLGRRVWAVHQLDRGTTGVLLFVRRKALVQRWQSALRGGSKRYLAIVHGVPSWESTEVDAAMAYDRKLGRPAVRGDGKPARTRLRVLDAGGAYARVEARPATGRTHQVRVHLAHLGHPLVGEALHREPPCEVATRAMLHLQDLRAAGVRIRAETPPDLEACWHALTGRVK